MLHTETSNRRAFQLYNAAKRQVSLYEQTFDLKDLEKAIKNLDESISADGNFFNPANYKGIVFDMKGQSKEAIEQFESILNESPDSVRDEVEFNKAVALYHRYSEEFIQGAIVILTRLDTTVNRDSKLGLLTGAVLAQCYAMMVHHSMRKTKVIGLDEASKAIESYKSQASNKANDVIQRVDRLRKKSLYSYLNEAKWIANNALGVSLMFADDKTRDVIVEGQRTKYEENLKNAVKYFDEAAQYSPNNWALACNQASARMRLGHMYMIFGETDKANENFTEAISRLDLVISKLRPGYDFAIYEIGRIYRFQGNMDKAISQFQRLIDASITNRNVGLETLIRELDAAKIVSTKFNSSN